ncbi:SIMPL domain-containing protein [Mesobacillus zeae]|uniref:DUF541 domain-containing protein n=1 Tax=Mesobacillus zeae TaxID=1917180 RepID=A0A398B7M4_9BACI|nr:SIMPL domain-containing protein [Mesobacillus zeae]RID83900.1 DUF541 domain-containing protein [Mesobacillus zeae]
MFDRNGTTQTLINVQGEGIRQTEPDTASAILGVRTESMKLKDAQERNARDTANVTAALLNLGVKQEDIQTTQYRIESIYSYEEGKQLFQGYRVTHLLAIKIRDINQAGTLIDKSVENGANEIFGVQFSLANADALYLSALSSAVRNAWEKAVLIGNTMGVKVSPIPVEITEASSSPPPVPFLAKSGASSTVPEPGMVQVKAIVTARFEILK